MVGDLATHGDDHDDGHHHEPAPAHFGAPGRPISSQQFRDRREGSSKAQVFSFDSIASSGAGAA
jgi:hypothetical protein